MGAVCCMILVDDTYYYPFLPSNSSSDLSGLIQGLQKFAWKTPPEPNSEGHKTITKPEFEKNGPTRFRHLPILYESLITFEISHWMWEEIGFEIVDLRNFDSLVTLILTFDDLESYIVRFVSSTSIHSIIEHVAPSSFIVNGRTDGRTYVRTDGHLIWF